MPLGKLLTEEGLHAFENGRFEALIDPKDRFRNGPAHGRFTPIEVAVECKAYVDNALKSLSTWIKSMRA